MDIGTAGAYSVLAGSAVTNTGPTTLSGDLGVSPGTAISGFPPGVVGGVTHADDAAALQAQSDLTTGYQDAAGRAKTASVSDDLVGRTLTAGVYKSSGPLSLSGTLTLDAQGNPDAVFIFQAASTLITASSSHVSLLNGAQACHVFWQVGSSATLGTTSTFKGTIMALTSVTVTTDATVQGRALARNGAVTLDNDTFTDASCATTPSPTASASTSSTSPSSTTTRSPTTTRSSASASSASAKASASSASAKASAAAAAKSSAAAAKSSAAAAKSAAASSSHAATSSTTTGGVAGTTTLTGTQLASTGVTLIQLTLEMAAALLGTGMLLAVLGRPRRTIRRRH